MSAMLSTDVIALAKQAIEGNVAIGRTVAVAESCTGGLVCAALTEIPGSSAVLDRGFVTYSNEAKREQLGVPMDIIETFGAVSPATAWAMAVGALRHSGADLAVAITGVAGPGGGSEQKPVGTVVFACARRGQSKDDVNAEQRWLDGKNRGEIRRQATLVALELLLP